MARGTAVGERVVSQANSKAFAEGRARIYGDRPVQRGRWVWDESRQKAVPAGEVTPRFDAKNAPIIADRIHEGVVSPVDGSSIGSRRRRRDHMKAYDLVDSGDVPPRYIAEKAKERERLDDRKRRLAMQAAARKLYSEGKWE
jgi:hypothetical protein